MERWNKAEENGRFLLFSNGGRFEPSYLSDGDFGRGSGQTSYFFTSDHDREIFILRDDLRRERALNESMAATIARLRTRKGAGRAYREALKADKPSAARDNGPG